MSTTTAYGYKIPDTGDTASSWMQDIEDNWNRMSAHDHDGTDSPALPAASITKYTTTIAGSGYTNDTGGNYSKVITVPGAVTEINNYLIEFYITSTGVRVFPTVERVSATSYRIRTNSQLALTAVYV